MAARGEKRFTDEEVLEHLHFLTTPGPSSSCSGVDLGSLEQACPLDNDWHEFELPPQPHRGLNSLPYEIQEHILLCCDLQSIVQLRSTSKTTRALVDDLPQYRTLFENAPDLMRACISARTSQYFALPPILATLRSWRCSYRHCPNFGSFVDLITLERLCVSCALSLEVFRPWCLRAVNYSGLLPRNATKSLPRMRAISLKHGRLSIRPTVRVVEFLADRRTVVRAAAQHCGGWFRLLVKYRKRRDAPPHLLNRIEASFRFEHPHGLSEDPQPIDEDETLDLFCQTANTIVAYGSKHPDQWMLSKIHVPYLDGSGNLSYGLRCNACHDTKKFASLIHEGRYLEHFRNCDLAQAYLHDVSRPGSMVRRPSPALNRVVN